MTEDLLQEHADILTQLGTSEEGARIRAQMQSASLMSDMEAFKVASAVRWGGMRWDGMGCDGIRWDGMGDNSIFISSLFQPFVLFYNASCSQSSVHFVQAANPGSLLEDFVRWYSPNDWLQGDETEEEIQYKRQLEIEQMEDGQGKQGGGAWDDEDDKVTQEELNEVGYGSDTMDGEATDDSSEKGKVKQHVLNVPVL